MECYPSKLKLLGLLGLTCLMVGLCYWVTTLPGIIEPAVGWFGVVFFGLGFIAIPIQFFRSGPQVIINDEGIEDRRTKVGVVRWEDILSLRIGKVESTKFLCIELADPEKYLSRASRWTRWAAAANRTLGFPAVVVGFSGLSPGLKEVWTYLQARERVPGGITPEA